MKNTIRNTIIAANLAFAMGTASQVFANDTADVDLQPLQAHTVSMQEYTAVVYYTVQDNGDYQIVTTFGPNIDVEGEMSQHRVTVKPGHSYELSMDSGIAGNPANVIRFTADDKALIVASR